MNTELENLRKQLAAAEAADRDARYQAEKDLAASFRYEYNVHWLSDVLVRVTKTLDEESEAKALAFYGKEKKSDLPSTVLWNCGGMTYIVAELASGNYIFMSTGGGLHVLRCGPGGFDRIEEYMTEAAYLALRNGTVLDCIKYNPSR